MSYAGVSFGWDAKNLFSKRKEEVCDKWKSISANVAECDIRILTNKKKCVVIEGMPRDPLRSRLLSLGNPARVRYIAANPPTYIESVSGSGLPYPNEEVAMEKTPNQGEVELGSNAGFRIQLQFPNSYYKELGKILVRPEIRLIFMDRKNKPLGDWIAVPLGEGIPYRSLTWSDKRNWLDGPLFFAGRESLPIRTQAQILEDSGYPCENQEFPNFWGLRPPAPEG